jgi:hypothetical protein
MNTDSARMKRILARLQTHVEQIDPRWSEKNIESHSAVISISEGYGFLAMYVSEINHGIASQSEPVSRTDGEQLATNLVNEAGRLREVAAELGKSDSETGTPNSQKS